MVTLWQTVLGRPPGGRMIIGRVFRRFRRLDHSGYQSVAAMSTPLLDGPLHQVTDFADFSKPWLLVAAALALFGGTRGRRAAAIGIVAIGIVAIGLNSDTDRTGDRFRTGGTSVTL